MPSAVVVEFADRGPGFAPGDEKRIFDKFYRGRPAGVHGVGLGLAICRAIVEAHGGTISAENRPGGGALFRFTLPLGGSPRDNAPADG
jgi:two-component system, OmpR family, sensor histidine kinase KdpD